jgi:hypothetical protein
MNFGAGNFEAIASPRHAGGNLILKDQGYLVLRRAIRSGKKRRANFLRLGAGFSAR